MPSRRKPLPASGATQAASERAGKRALPRTVRLPAGVTVPPDLDPVAKLRCAAWHLMGEGRWAEAAKLAARATRYESRQSHKPGSAPD